LDEYGLYLKTMGNNVGLELEDGRLISSYRLKPSVINKTNNKQTINKQ